MSRWRKSEEDSTYGSKRMHLRWDGFGNVYITMHIHIWNLHILVREVSVRRGLNITSMNIPYRLWGKVIVCGIVIGPGCVDVAGVRPFTLHEYISCWLRDALPSGALLVITNHMRVLKNETHE
jgi:hypothetical protein